MSTSVGKYRVRRGLVEELARRVRQDFVPMLQESPGFRRYLST